jgi:hypothetical protein
MLRAVAVPASLWISAAFQMQHMCIYVHLCD